MLDGESPAGAGWGINSPTNRLKNRVKINIG
jgi:hypothetical protein